MTIPAYDIAVIGGGINGCGVARDAAGRGFTVCLVEQNDLAGATSSASTKLIHGGLRYLEGYHFGLVAHALKERAVLSRIAPHLTRPLRFVLPHHKGLRPRWMLRLGLFLYDRLGGASTFPGSKSVALDRDAAGLALKPAFRHAFEYSDCQVDDSRLTVLNAVDARALGAHVMTRTRCIAAERVRGIWSLTLEGHSGVRSTVSSRTLVNAAGPWVDQFLSEAARVGVTVRARLDKGSHIVVPKLFDHDRAYLFQNKDARVVFAIPYLTDYTLIGTTEKDYPGDPSMVAANEEEIAYLISAVNEYLRNPVRREDIVWSFSGVRTLHDDGAVQAQQATRDFVFAVDAPKSAAPLVTIYGGKLTTYRLCAEAVLARLGPYLGAKPSWTSRVVLPGGDMERGMDGLKADLRWLFPFLETRHLDRLASAYGTRAFEILGKAKALNELGRNFGADLFEAEVRYLVEEEWAMTADDILWRRSKLGLKFTPGEKDALQRWLEEAGAGRVRA
ncbi:MAG TPA: glycerol-3-phosphate dehydrogenase [Micropepsaceae bacterium]|nr:glycerol-3-phosphate dehydrogenase [Micropepsaceae bacterium]